jgi:hypothetical protein
MRRLWSKDLVEETIGLSPHSLIKQELYSGTLDGDIKFSINTDLCFVRLRYRLPDGTLQCYDLQLDPTPCHFGGNRWWIVCHFCGGRCRTVYLPAERAIFACRGCCRLAYRSQRINPIDRAALACQKIAARFPGRRPKGMWRSTFYCGLVARAQAEDRLWHLAGVDSIEASSRVGLLAEIGTEPWAKLGK